MGGGGCIDKGVLLQKNKEQSKFIIIIKIYVGNAAIMCFLFTPYVPRCLLPCVDVYVCKVKSWRIQNIQIKIWE
jgi:hypothetical protein